MPLLWREHRGLTQEDLGEQVGLSGSYLSRIESDKRDGTVRVYAALARALGVDVDDFVAARDDEWDTSGDGDGRCPEE